METKAIQLSEVGTGEGDGETEGVNEGVAVADGVKEGVEVPVGFKELPRGLGVYVMVPSDRSAVVTEEVTKVLAASVGVSVSCGFRNNGLANKKATTAVVVTTEPINIQNIESFNTKEDSPTKAC